MDVIAPPPFRMSVAEFLEWEPGDGQSWQLIDGVPEPMAPSIPSCAMLHKAIGRPPLSAFYRTKRLAPPT